MFLHTTVSPVANIHYLLSKKRERQIGYRLILHNLAPHWIDSTHIFDMTPVWRRFGEQAMGVNYFTIGAIQNGLSSRFEAMSPYYQAWLGGYIIQFPKPRSWNIEDHFGLAVADQKNWLQLYGMRNPFVEVDASAFKTLGRLRISGKSGMFYKGNIWSNSDVGAAKPLFLPPMMAGAAHHWNKHNSKLHLTYKNFLPLWSDREPLRSFQKILLKGFMGLFQLNSTTTALLYANGAEFTDRDGMKHDHFATIEHELEKLLKKIEIVPT